MDQPTAVNNGFSIEDQDQQGQSQQAAPAVPNSGDSSNSGFSIEDAPAKGNDDYLSKTEDAIHSGAVHAGNIASNMGRAAIGTLGGANDLIHKATGGLVGDQGAIDKAKAVSENTQGTGFDKAVGYGGETLLEIVMGDEALKGLSLADKLLDAHKIMKVIERVPKLAELLKMGASVGKAAAELSPEESVILKRYPTIARLVGSGMDAARLGTVQGGQTLARTGDVGEAAKQGLETAGTAGVIGAAAAPFGGALSKVAEGNDTIGELSDVAKTAPEHQDITSDAAEMMKNAKQKMHTDYDNTIKGMVDKAGDETVPHEGSPMQMSAKNIDQTASDLERPLDAAYQGSTPNSKQLQKIIDDTINPFQEEEEEAAKAAKSKIVDESGTPYEKEAVEKAPTKDFRLKMQDLIDYRMSIGEKMRDLEGIGASAADRSDHRIYQELREGIDKTIEQLANKTGNPDLIGEYQSANSAYREKLKMFDNPDVKSLLAGKLDDVAKSISSGKTALHDIKTISNILGDGNMSTLGDAISNRWIADSTQGNRFSPDAFLKLWNKSRPDVRDVLFNLEKPYGPVTQRVDAYNKFIDSVKGAASTQRLIKYGMVSPAGAAVGFGLGHLLGPVPEIIGALIGGGGTAGIGHATKFIDYVANHPALWNSLSYASKLGASPLVKTAATAGKAAAGQGVDKMLKSVYSGTSNSLSQ